MSKIKIFSLGGLNEVGKNMYIVEVDQDIFVFDAGLKYADEIHKLYQDKELLVFPENYTPREKDLWKPLYAIAKIVDKELNIQTVNSILSYAEILRQELDKTKYTELTPRIIKYLEILVNEQDEIKEHPDWYKLEDMYYFLKDTGEFGEIKSFESLGRYLSKFELQKDRKTYGGINSKKRMSYYITKGILKDLRKKYNLDNV